MLGFFYNLNLQFPGCLLNAENKSKISSICFLKRVDKTWSFKTSKEDQKEC